MATAKKAAARPRAKKKATVGANSAKKPAGHESNICFVITPFGGWFDDYYESVYCPAIIAAGMEPHRADDLYRPSTIVHDIWAYTKKAKLILADLTGKNANVFYELGLAHALAKPAILIAASMDDVPFDLRALRVLEYDKNAPKWGEVLAEKITKSILEIAEASYIQSVLPGFLAAKEEAEPKPVSKANQELLQLRQQVELLRNEVRGSHRRPQISAPEAEKLVRSYVMRGMPESVIVERLVSRGAPYSWTERQIQEVNASLQEEADSQQADARD